MEEEDRELAIEEDWEEGGDDDETTTNGVVGRAEKADALPGCFGSGVESEASYMGFPKMVVVRVIRVVRKKR